MCNPLTKAAAAAEGDLVAVVHADTLVKAPAFTTMCRVLQRRPCLAGGALGSVFETRGPGLRLVGLANDARTVLTGISFCDFVGASMFLEKPAGPDAQPASNALACKAFDGL